MKTIKSLLIASILVIFQLYIQGCSSGGTKKLKTYQVKITFCDGRPQEWKILVYDHKPSNADIKVYDLAKPILYETSTYDRTTVKFIDVCDVEVLSVK